MLISRSFENETLTEKVPAVAIGVILGPIAAKFIDSERWGSAKDGQTSEITLVNNIHAAGNASILSALLLTFNHNRASPES